MRSLLMTAALVCALGSVQGAYTAEPAPTDPAARFKALSADAEAAFRAKRYQEAIDAYLEAYGVVPSAEVLYNIAYIYDRHLANRGLAKDFYSRVVRTPESSKDILALATKRLTELEAEDKAEVKVIAPTLGGTGPRSGDTPAAPAEPRVGDATSVPDPDPPVDPGGPGVAPWILVGAGGAALVTGVVLAVSAQSTHDDFRATDDLDEKRSLGSDGESLSVAADVLMFGGAALAAGGLVWYFVASSGEPTGQGSVNVETSLAPMLMPDGMGLTFGGQW